MPRLMFGSCSVDVRYLFGITLDNYWTYSGHVLDIYWTCVEGNPLLSGRKGMGQICLVY